MKITSHAPSRIAVGILAATTAVLLAACSSSPTAPETGADSSSASSTPTDIAVGYSPSLPYAALNVGQSEGIFASHNLNVTLTETANGPDAIPLLIQGSLQFTRIDIATAVYAASQGLGVVAIAPVTVGQDTEKGFTSIMVNPDLGIKTAADLEGKNVQVNAIGGTAQLLVSATVAEAGGDPSKVNFVEVAVPQAIAALQQGSVDAITSVEPLQTAAEAAGFEYLVNPELVIPGVPTFVYVTTQKYADENPEVVQQFQDALFETFTFANANNDVVRDEAVKVAGLDAALVDKLTMPHWGEDPLTADQIQTYLDLLVKYGDVDESTLPDAASLIWTK